MDKIEEMQTDERKGLQLPANTAVSDLTPIH